MIPVISVQPILYQLPYGAKNNGGCFSWFFPLIIPSPIGPQKILEEDAHLLPEAEDLLLLDEEDRSSSGEDPLFVEAEDLLLEYGEEALLPEQESSCPRIRRRGRGFGVLFWGSYRGWYN